MRIESESIMWTRLKFTVLGCISMAVPQVSIGPMVYTSCLAIYTYLIFPLFLPWLFFLRYYPYHYAPFMSDLKQFSGQPLEKFELGEPLFPLHQLLAKLHPDLKALLPQAYQVADTIQLLTYDELIFLPQKCLVVNRDSPLIDFFPADLNNWDQVVFHSYIDKVSKVVCTRLTYISECKMWRKQPQQDLFNLFMWFKNAKVWL